MHFKVCLPHGLKVLLCLWGPEEVGQMAPIRADYIPDSVCRDVDSSSMNGLSTLPAASITNRLFKIGKKSATTTTSLSHTP